MESINKYFRAKPKAEEVEKLINKGFAYCGGWVDGVPSPHDDNIFFAKRKNGYEPVEVDPETIGQYACMADENGTDICQGDIIKIADRIIGEIIFTAGTFGVGTKQFVDYDFLASQIAPITGCNNSPRFCYEDNFISLYEMYVNFNGEEDVCPGIVVIGNIHDNPELLSEV